MEYNEFKIRVENGRAGLELINFLDDNKIKYRLEYINSSDYIFIEVLELLSLNADTKEFIEYIINRAIDEFTVQFLDKLDNLEKYVVELRIDNYSLDGIFYINKKKECYIRSYFTVKGTINMMTESGDCYCNIANETTDIKSGYYSDSKIKNSIIKGIYYGYFRVNKNLENRIKNYFNII